MPTKVKMPSKPVGTAASGSPATNSPEAEAAGDEAASLIESGSGWDETQGHELGDVDPAEYEPDLGESSTVGEQPAVEPAGEGLVALDDLFGDSEDVEAAEEKARLDRLYASGGINDAAGNPLRPRPSDDATEADETDDTLDDLYRAEQKCAACESVVETLKGELKEAKEAYDDAVNDLRKLARGVRKDRNRPLFDRMKASSTPPATAADGSESQPAAAAASTQSIAWRSHSIAELDLGDALSERLENAGISTIGQLQDMQAEIALGREKWPKGIGAAKITKIEDAVIAWLGKNRDAGLLGGDTSSVPVTPVDESLSPTDRLLNFLVSEGKIGVAEESADGIPGSDDPTDVEGEESATEDEEAAAYAAAWDAMHEKAERTVVLQATSPEFESRFGQGMADFQNGESHYACPAEDAQGQWNWMLGWTCAERQAAKEHFESGAEAESTPDPLADLADL